MTNRRNMLGLLPGEGIPMERHGDMGILYNPIVQLTGDEMKLLGKLYQTADERQFKETTREDGIRLLQEIADLTVPDASLRAQMVEHIIAWNDEMNMIYSEGSA